MSTSARTFGDVSRMAAMIVLVAFGLLLTASPLVAAGPPNIVLIMTDNHGAWTLGCYGNRDIRTPNIDRLAAEGLKFNRAFSSNAVCSPTRATFLTGLLPSQHGVHCFLHREPLQVGPNARSTIAEFDSLPQVLNQAGYNCGLVGKWHLGDNTRPQEGFQYWITMPHGGTTTFYNAEIIQDGQIQRYPGYLTDLWTEHAVRFIDGQSSAKPFFLFLSYNGPYGLGKMLLTEGQNRHVGHYANLNLPSFPRESPHSWLFNNQLYINNPTAIRRYAAELSAVDDGVGTVMSRLRSRGLDRNTLVVFTADQGWLGGQGGFWGMGDHTRPLTAYDGMLRIPMIFRQPGVIPAGRETDLMVSNYDFMPTVLGYLGMGTGPVATSPGRDFSALLRGREVKEWDNTVFFEFENTRSIRTAEWKYIKRLGGPNELYNLTQDPGERTNLVGNRPEQRELDGRLEAFFGQHADPQYDLWRGGGSKTRLLVSDARVLTGP